jgi:hypothetical protein
MAFRVVYEKKENIPEESLKWTPSQGTWTSTDGRKYVGEWKDDKKHGVDAFRSRNNSTGSVLTEDLINW